MAEGAYNFIILARQLATYCNYKKAFEMYLCLFDKHPETRLIYEPEFHEVLTTMNVNLGAAGHKADIFANLERAIAVFPASAKILNDIGTHLFRYGFYSEALCHFEKALNIDRCSVSIEKNLNSSKSWVFPRCNFRCLNDRYRNDAYRRAIQSCVTDTDGVVNIGAGTGLLALYAAACAPASTIACEVSGAMASLTECVMQHNDAPVAVVNEKPATINRTDIRGTRTVLLTDMFDSGLFGYYILHSICDVWENLPLSGVPDSVAIPGSAEYFVVGVSCDELIRKYQLCADAKRTLNVPDMIVHRATNGERYCGEDVHLYEDLKYMTEPTSLFKINFNRYQDVFENLRKQTLYTAALRAEKSGEINAVVGYFNLHLNEDIIVTSDPLSEHKATAWQQAVFFDVVPRAVKKNDEIHIPFTTDGGILVTVPTADVQIARISVRALKFLNDTDYMKMISDCLGTVCIHLGQLMALSYVDIVDFSPFPMFGVLMMMRGANSLICHAILPEDKVFLQAVLRANDIPEHKVTILVGKAWSDEAFKDKKFHIIYKHTLNFTGDTDIQRKELLEHLVAGHLHENGLTLPARLSLMGQLVNSEWLEINNRVRDENLHGYKMADHVNRYQVSQALCLDFSRLEYTPISEEFVIATSFHDMKSDVVKVPVKTDGVINAILCWYKIQVLEDRGFTTTKRGNSCMWGMAFLTECERVFVGDEANVLTCVDPDSLFKCVIDVEP